MSLVLLTILLLAAPCAGSQERGALRRGAPPPCAACIVVVLAPAQIAVLPAALHGLDVLVSVEPGMSGLAERVAIIRQRGGRPGLLLSVAETAAADAIELPADIEIVALDIRTWTMSPAAALFALRTRTVALRAGSARSLRVLVYPPPRLQVSLQAEAGGYWDGLVSAPASTGEGGQWLDVGEVHDLQRTTAATRSRAFDRWMMRLPEEEALARRVVSDLALLARWLPAGLIGADGDSRLACDGRDIELFLDPASLDRVGVAEWCGPESPLVNQSTMPVERMSLASGGTVVRLAEPEGDRFASGVSVAAARRLTAAEIVARHQAAAVREAATIRTLISTGTLTVTFEAPGFPAPFVITSATTVFRDASATELAQDDVRVNGLALGGRGISRLPLLEAERVAAPPLAITLGDRYRYRRLGDDTRDGRPCYVITFAPYPGTESLFRGRAWIDSEDFGLVRIGAAQTGLRGPVTASEQVDDFARLADGRRVLARSEVSQLYQGAAARIPIHRVLALARHEVNAADFSARRAASYVSARAVLRDTPAGYRYLEPQAPAVTTAGEDALPAAPAVLVGSAAAPIRTVAYGVIVDPNITRPLPFAGLSYVDFDLFGSGVHINSFFGGTYGQLAFSVPALGRSRWQLAGRAFGIAASYNDRMFVAGREQYQRNIRQRPAFASMWVMRPISPRLAIRAGYEWDYTHFGRLPATASAFTIPASHVAHGVRIALDAQRRGWDVSLWGSAARRAGWRRWGRIEDADYAPAQRAYQRFGVTIARPLIVAPRLVVRAEAAAMSGHNLDRFSRYAFGTFDNRLRGYPAALIRYDRGAVVRSVLAWSAARVVRLDLFADAAVVRDRGFRRGLTRVAGFGAAIEAPAPLGTLLAVEWGYGAQGVNADGRRGTHVLRFSGYRVF